MKKLLIAGLLITMLLIIAGSYNSGNLNEPEMMSSNDTILEDITASDDEVKTKTLYYHNETSSLSGSDYQMNTTMGTSEREVIETGGSRTLTWDLEPNFVDNFHINGTLTTYIWIRITDTPGGTNKLDNFILDVDEINGTSGSWESDICYKESGQITNIPGHYVELSQSCDGIDKIIPKNNSIRVNITLNKAVEPTLYIAFGNESFPSRLEVETPTHIDIDSFKVLNYTYDENYTFPLSASDHTIHFNTTITNPFGGYDIKWVNLTLEGPNGTVFEDEPMIKVSGNSTTYVNNYTYPWDYGGASEGEYTVTLEAVDNTGYHYRYPDHPDDETYGGHLESESKTFFIGGKLYFVNFKTIDSMDNPLDGARVEIDSQVGVYVTHNYTNETGYLNITLRGGNYSIEVYWQDVLVNETVIEVDMDVTWNNPVTLNCDVFYPQYKVLDSAHKGVNSANLFIGHPNGTLLKAITDKSGYASIDQLPIGNYSIKTEWLGREVNSTVHRVDSNDQFTINGNIYYLTVTTKDQNDVAVPDVHTIVTFNDTQSTADADLTDNEGNVTFRLPWTESGFGYNLTFRWHGVNVGNVSNWDLTDNRSEVVVLEIYYVDFHTDDSLSEDLENVLLAAYTDETDAFANSGETDDSGDVTIRLPLGDHTIEAYWRGVLVGTAGITVQAGMPEVQIQCSVYHITFRLVDSREIPLENGRISVEHPSAGILYSNVSNENGEAYARLPGSNVDITVSWKGAEVYSQSTTLDANGDMDISCEVYYLSIKAVDDVGEPLENARIEYILGTDRLNSVVTDADGNTPESRLPGVSIDVYAYWKNIEVYHDSLSITDNDNKTIATSVYHLDIELLDSQDIVISGGEIEIYHHGAFMDSDITDENGLAQARLPGETHRFIVTWKGVNIYDSDITVDHSGTYTINAVDVYYVTLRFVDSRGETVNSASVDVSVYGKNLISGVSDENGYFSFRTPTPFDSDGTVDLLVHWKNVNVFESSITVSESILSPDHMDINLQIYYIEYKITDVEGVPIEKALIKNLHSELPLGSNTLARYLTDGNGSVVMRSPRGEQTITVFWNDIKIHNEIINLDGDATMDVQGNVYYLTVDVLDDDQQTLEDALIRVSYLDRDKLYESNYSDENGRVTFRIPASEWDIYVTWLGSPIYEDTVNVTNSEESWHLDARSDVYYLTVVTEDTDGKLSGVYVVVESGDRIWSGYTENGEYTFKLPAGDDYTIKAAFKTTYMLTEVDLDESKEVTLSSTGEEKVEFGGYPIPVYKTNLFYALAALLILLVLIGLAYWKIGAPHVEMAEDEELYEEDFEGDYEETSEPEDFDGSGEEMLEIDENDDVIDSEQT